MKGRRNPFVAREGFPFLAVTLIGAYVAWQYAGASYAIPPALLFGYFVLVFRDPDNIQLELFYLKFVPPTESD